MFGVPRFRESTFTCESGVWNSWVMIPAHDRDVVRRRVEHDDVAEAEVGRLELGRRERNAAARPWSEVQRLVVDAGEELVGRLHRHVAGTARVGSTASEVGWKTSAGPK